MPPTLPPGPFGPLAPLPIGETFRAGEVASLTDVLATAAITRLVNHMISQGIDSRAILARLVADAVQLETRLNAQYPDRVMLVEDLVEHARAKLEKKGTPDCGLHSLAPDKKT